MYSIHLYLDKLKDVLHLTKFCNIYKSKDDRLVSTRISSISARARVGVKCIPSDTNKQNVTNTDQLQ